MPQNQAPINQTIKTVDQIIQFALYEVGVRALKSAAFAEMPFLKVPPLSWIFDGVVNWVAGKLYVELSQTATFTILDIKTDAEKRAYAKAEGLLRSAHLTGNQEALDEATKNFKQALGSLIHFDGHVPT